MRISFRSKLLAVVATATLAIVALVLTSTVISRRVEGHLGDIQRRYLPKVGLRPQLEAQFERIQRGFQDAVAANDSELLARTAGLKQQFLQRLAASSDAVDPVLARALAHAIEEFHAAGQALTTRLIAGQTGEALVIEMAELQNRRKRVAELLDQATRFDQAELANAFSAAAAAQQIGSRVRLAVGIACLLVVFLLFLWISRDLLRSLAHLTAGFRRFGAGEFATPIPVQSSDELGDLARQANLMSQSLQHQRGALEEKNAALLDTRRRLEQQADELTKASAYKSQFLANMSHELRTPLNAIIGFAELLHDEEVGPLQEQQKEFLGDVLRSGRHLLQLINDVLDLSKVEAGKLDFRPERVDPERLISEVLAILRTTASTRRVQIDSQVDGALGELIIDPARLKQVL
jgi:phosphoglycerate-specific signal transduction histidine kinase